MSPTKMSMSSALYRLMLVDDRYLGFDAKVGEQLLDGDCAQFRAGDAIVMREQPMDRERLAAQRQKHAAPFRQRKLFEIFHEERVGFAFVKIDFVLFPFLTPETSSIVRAPVKSFGLSRAGHSTISAFTRVFDTYDVDAHADPRIHQDEPA